MRVLVMTAVPEERYALLHGLSNNTNFDVLTAGVGPAAAAASTAKALTATEYDLVIAAGIAGGFSGRSNVGSLVVAEEIVAADLGVETPEGFSSLEELGFGPTRINTHAELVKLITAALITSGEHVVTGPVLTVSTVTGTNHSAEALAARVPGAAAEAMEGFGVAIAAQAAGIPVIEIRAISNLVGHRDRTSWRILEALRILENASLVLSEVLT